MADAQLRFAVANLADIKNRMSAPAADGWHCVTNKSGRLQATIPRNDGLLCFTHRCATIPLEILSRSGRVSDLHTIQELYDRHRFLEAYCQSAEYWKPSKSLELLSSGELILGGRLAARLGGLRLSRRLFRAAYARDPSNPRVQYFSIGCRRRAQHLVDYLRAIEVQPELNGADGEVQASWFALQAITWASLRDFARADASLERAHSVAMDDAWVWTCESHVRGLADRWEDALRAAERAWEISPGAPHAAVSLGNSLINLGRVGESARRLRSATENSQSYEVALLASWHQCALAETLDGEERFRVLDCARSMAESLTALAPLADREAQVVFARARLDVAELLGDREKMEGCERELKSPFHRRVLENMQKNPEGRRFVLPFRRTIQKNEACLPASVSSALVSLGVNLDPDAMASEITHGGTPPWAAAEWLEARGMAVRFFSANPGVASTLIKQGIAFILLMESDESSHAVAVVGLDESAGTLVIHDPQTFRTGQYLLAALKEVKLPLGPKGMAVVPTEKAAHLDTLLAKEDVDVMTAAHLHQKALAMNTPAAAREIVEALACRHPQHSGTRWLQALRSLEGGRTSEALASFQRLLNEFPACAYARRSLVSACRALGNTAVMREVLANVVYSGRLPGIQSDLEWRYPPASYVSEYADLLRLSAASRQEARRLLNSVLERERTFALPWHVLGDLLWHQHDIAGALLAFRVASCLANSDDHFARSYSDALRGAGREAEGLAWLEARVRTLGASSRAMGPWIAWISVLEDYGYPERALAACDDALRQHGEEPELLTFAVPFFARMGHLERAESGLRQLGAEGHSPRYHQAAVEFYRMRGDLDLAIESAEQWVRMSPQSIQARQQLSESIAKRQGPHAALELAKRWSLENPGHEQLEEIYYHRLDSTSGAWKKDLLLRRRVKRNSEDGWAWRELTFRRLADYEIANQRRREKLQPVITSLLAECDRTAPEAPATLRAHAEWLTVRGEWPQAVSAWLRAIDAEPDRFHSYQRIWDCSAMLPDAERRAVLQQIEALFLAHPGRLPNARDLVFLIAERFGTGAAEEAAMRWKAQRGDEPELTESAADLLLAEGHGRSDAARALDMLEPAVQRFPYYLGLRLSLANAYQRLGRVAEAEEAYREVVRRHPDHTEAHIQMAWVLARRGDGDEALRLLESVTARDPMNPALWDARAGILIGNRRFSEARTVLQEGLQKLSDNAQYRDRVIQRLLECDANAGAVEMARELVRAYPRGAYIWYLLATTLQRTCRFAAPGEIESCYRRSVSLNASLFPAADALAILLVEGRRYEGAGELMRSILPRLGDPSPARGRLAWIHRQAGRKAQALDELLAVLRAAPWYRWGWAVVMDWLAEDQAWEKARSLLSASPPELRTDIRLRSKRLTVLGEAGLPAGEIDAEWDVLLKDFPDDIPPHLERYDSLWAAKRATEAAGVLEPLRLVAPDNPWVLARLVEVLADQQKNAEAVDAFLRLWFGEGEVSAWAIDYAWKAVERAHLGDECYQNARRRLDQGALPSQGAFSLMVTHAMRGESTKKARQPPWRVWFPGKGAREALALLDFVHNSGRSDRGYEAVVLRNLSRCGHQRLVASLWKKGRTLAESDVYSWAEVGRTLINLGRKKQALALLGNWRERQGVKMWTVANYLLCFPRGGRKRWQEIRSVCQNALETLPHDHCAKYLAHVQAEMSACLGDAAAFRETWTKQQAYFTGKLEESEWFEARRRYLLGDIPCAARLLEQNQGKLFNKACKDLRRKRYGLLGSQGRRSGFGGLPWWAWWILLLALQLLRLINRH